LGGSNGCVKGPGTPMGRGYIQGHPLYGIHQGEPYAPHEGSAVTAGEQKAN